MKDSKGKGRWGLSSHKCTQSSKDSAAIICPTEERQLCGRQTLVCEALTIRKHAHATIGISWWGEGGETGKCRVSIFLRTVFLAPELKGDK